MVSSNKSNVPFTKRKLKKGCFSEQQLQKLIQDFICRSHLDHYDKGGGGGDGGDGDSDGGDGGGILFYQVCPCAQQSQHLQSTNTS